MVGRRLAGSDLATVAERAKGRGPAISPVRLYQLAPAGARIPRGLAAGAAKLSHQNGGEEAGLLFSLGGRPSRPFGCLETRNARIPLGRILCWNGERAQ